MLRRALVLVVALSVPAEAQAAGYVVQRGDTLGIIAQRSHLSVYALARANGIRDPNMVRAGRALFVPRAIRIYGYGVVRGYRSYGVRWKRGYSVRRSYARAVWRYRPANGTYRIRWGDTLYGLALRYGTTVAAIRAMNPSLGTYLLAGHGLHLCGPCGTAAGATGQAEPRYHYPVRRSLVPYAVRTGYIPFRIVPRYTRSRAVGPAYAATVYNRGYVAPRAAASGAYTSYQARALIASYARQYGLESSLPLAIGAQESGFRQTAISGAGAIGVMQVEPNTARQISTMLGRPVNLYSLDDNIHAGVFWLAHLVARYGGNERLAAAAYYQGGSALASRGFYNDTVRYVSHAMALKSRYGG